MGRAQSGAWPDGFVRLAAVLLGVCTACGPPVHDRAKAVDPAALGFPTQRPSSDEEFNELQALLDSLQDHFGGERKFGAPDPASIVSARLACFERRLGCDPRAQPQWADLQRSAARLLEWAGDRGSPEAGRVQHVSAQMDRLVLLDILGRDDEVSELLRTVNTTGADCCIYCTAENAVVVNQRRSEQAERRGDLSAALAAQIEAALDTQAVADKPLGALMRSEAVAGEAWIFFRLGILLLADGREDEGRLLLAALGRCFPDSDAAGFAWSELESRGWEADAGPARAMAALSVLAVWDAEKPESLRWIGARVLQDDCASPIRTLRTTEFEVERGRLEAALERPESAAWALRLLHGLRGGAWSYVGTYLDVAARTEFPAGPVLSRGDEALRWLYRGGPDATRFTGGAAGFVQAWREWIERHAPG